MLSTAALSIVFALGAADLNPTSVGELPALTIAGAPVRAAPHGGMRLALRSSLLDSDHTASRSNGSLLAQATRPHHTASAPAASPSPSPPPSSPPPAEASPAPAESTDASAAPAEEEPDIELLRQRARLTRMHRALGFATLGSLAATEILGTFAAINQPTIFGTGLCFSASGCFLGDQFGSTTLTQLHAVSAFITVGFYTATGIFALSMPDPEHASQGNDRRAVRLRIHKGLAIAHLVGMIAQPILGIIAYQPSTIGVYMPDPNFQPDMRTVHLFVGYATFLALASAMVVELLD
jgi:hypothetical protein